MKNETGRDGSEHQGGSCYHGNHPGVCGSRHRDTQTPMRLVSGGWSPPDEGPCATHLEWFPSCPYHFTGGTMTKSLLLFQARLKCLFFWRGSRLGWKSSLLGKNNRLSVLSYATSVTWGGEWLSCKPQFPIAYLLSEDGADSLGLGWGDILILNVSTWFETHFEPSTDDNGFSFPGSLDTQLCQETSLSWLQSLWCQNHVSFISLTLGPGLIPVIHFTELVLNE